MTLWYPGASSSVTGWRNTFAYLKILPITLNQHYLFTWWSFGHSWLFSSALYLAKLCRWPKVRGDYSLFFTRRICSREQRKKQLDWLATNTDDFITQSHSFFACSRKKKYRQVENELKEFRDFLSLYKQFTIQKDFLKIFVRMLRTFKDLFPSPTVVGLTCGITLPWNCVHRIYHWIKMH